MFWWKYFNLENNTQYVDLNKKKCTIKGNSSFGMSFAASLLMLKQKTSKGKTEMHDQPPAKRRKLDSVKENPKIPNFMESSVNMDNFDRIVGIDLGVSYIGGSALQKGIGGESFLLKSSFFKMSMAGESTREFKRLNYVGDLEKKLEEKRNGICMWKKCGSYDQALAYVEYRAENLEEGQRAYCRRTYARLKWDSYISHRRATDLVIGKYINYVSY